MKAQKMKLDICRQCLETTGTSIDLKRWCVNQLSELVKQRVNDQKIEHEDTAKDKEQLSLIDMPDKKLQFELSVYFLTEGGRFVKRKHAKNFML